MPVFNKEIGRGQFGVVYSTSSDWSKADDKMEIAIKAIVPQNERQWGDLAQGMHAEEVFQEIHVVNFVGV